MDNTLVPTARCEQCGEVMHWTQNAWHEGEMHSAGHQCPSGHAVDPALTRQCPKCGVHDTAPTGTEQGRQQFKCLRCGESFQIPR